MIVNDHNNLSPENISSIKIKMKYFFVENLFILSRNVCKHFCPWTSAIWTYSLKKSKELKDVEKNKTNKM